VTTAHPLRRARSRRGVGFLWFALVVIPFFFAGSVLAFDATRLMLAKREVANVAQAAAVSAANEFSPNSTVVNPNNARVAARSLVAHASAANSLRVAEVDLGSIRTTVSPDNVTVAVAFDFRVTGLVFLRYFGVSGGSEPGSVSRSAFVCVPGQRGVDSGNFCQRPN
jgi:Flp pilus assembly protein TadG